VCFSAWEHFGSQTCDRISSNPGGRLAVAAFLVAARTDVAKPPMVYRRSNLQTLPATCLPGLAAGRSLGFIFSISARGLVPTTPSTAHTYPLGTTLGNVSVTLKPRARDRQGFCHIYGKVNSRIMKAIMP